MAVTARQFLPLHGKRQQLFARQRIAEQRIDGEKPSHGARRTGPQSAADGHLFMQFDGYAEVIPADMLQIGQHTGTHRSEEHTSELQSRENLVCRLLLEKKKKRN